MSDLIALIGPNDIKAASQMGTLYPGTDSPIVEGLLGVITAAALALDPLYRPYTFAHIADGNLQIVLNVLGQLDSVRVVAVEEVLSGAVAQCGGSFSAEHGIGSKHLHAVEQTAKLPLMRWTGLRSIHIRSATPARMSAVSDADLRLKLKDSR